MEVGRQKSILQVFSFIHDIIAYVIKILFLEYLPIVFTEMEIYIYKVIIR